MGSWFKKHKNVIKIAAAIPTGGLSLLPDRTLKKIPVVSSVSEFISTPSTARTVVAATAGAIATGGILGVGAGASGTVGGLAGSAAGGGSSVSEMTMTPGTDLSNVPGASDLVNPTASPSGGLSVNDMLTKIGTAGSNILKNFGSGGGGGGGGGKGSAGSPDTASLVSSPLIWVILFGGLILILTRGKH